ncbi:rna-directed dna polymerase from mobile element jockey-like [Pitangus sulphuratus]|nr:rna-directed dna polymerase from mobile element jockey-like [Pitangus sulphuratus]
MGPDGIHPRVMRELAEELTKPLSIIYQQSWLNEEVPDDWRLVNVKLIHKKSFKEDTGNYRPVNLTSMPGKVMEQILLSAVTQHLQDGQGIRARQHSGVPWGYILGPVLFNIFINDLDAELEGILSKSADDTKLGEAVDSLKGREALQRDLDKSEDWAITSHMKLKKEKCRILHLGWGYPSCSRKLGNEMLESSAMERDLVSCLTAS